MSDNETVLPSGERDWTEDYADEDNGCYGKVCGVCGLQYHGHKHRHSPCKLCSAKLAHGEKVIAMLRSPDYQEAVLSVPEKDDLLLRIGVLEKSEKSAVELLLKNFALEQDARKATEQSKDGLGKPEGALTSETAGSREPGEAIDYRTSFSLDEDFNNWMDSAALPPQYVPNGDGDDLYTEGQMRKAFDAGAMVEHERKTTIQALEPVCPRCGVPKNRQIHEPGYSCEYYTDIEGDVAGKIRSAVAEFGDDLETCARIIGDILGGRDERQTIP